MTSQPCLGKVNMDCLYKLLHIINQLTREICLYRTEYKQIGSDTMTNEHIGIPLTVTEKGIWKQNGAFLIGYINGELRHCVVSRCWYCKKPLLEKPYRFRNNGELFCSYIHARRYKHGPRKRRRLTYREIYERANGKIPDGYVVHHIDGDSSNNDPENLVALTNSEHMKIHANAHSIVSKTEAYRRVLVQIYGNRKK